MPAIRLLLLVLVVLHLDLKLGGKVDALVTSSSTAVSDRPLMATLMGRTIGIGTRILLLSTPSIPLLSPDLSRTKTKSISVDVTGESNRQILKGNIQSLKVNVNQSHGLLYDIDSLQIRASNLSLGLWPLLALVFPPLLFLLRPNPINMFLCYWLYRYYSRSRQAPGGVDDTSKASNNSPSLVQSFRNKLRKPKPFKMNYKLSLSQDNLNKSNLWKLGLQQILKSIMMNSVLKVAAEFGDTMTQLQKDIDRENNNNVMQKSNSRFFRLNPSSTSEGHRIIHDDRTRSDGDALGGIGSAKPPIQEESAVLTKLLEATKFELGNVTLADGGLLSNGRLVMNADAIMKEDTAKFSYTLRMGLALTRVSTVLEENGQVHEQEFDALAFATPEVRFQTSALVGGGGGGGGGRGIFEKFKNNLPDLWIPVGPGIAFPLSRRHQIENIRIIKKKKADDDDLSSSSNCVEIVGRHAFFANTDKNQSSISFRRPPLPPPPKALPPSSGN